MGCNRFAYSKVHLCCASAFPFLSSWRLFPGKYFRLQIPIFRHQAQLAPAPGAGAWPIVVFSHGMGCNRFAYSKVHLYCACVVHSLKCHLGACSQVSIFDYGSLSTRCRRHILAPATGYCRFLPRHGLQSLRLLQGTLGVPIIRRMLLHINGLVHISYLGIMQSVVPCAAWPGNLNQVTKDKER
jgi:hypothetical protein